MIPSPVASQFPGTEVNSSVAERELEAAAALLEDRPAKRPARPARSSDPETKKSLSLLALNKSMVL
jgi:hypothetical protein